MIKEFLTDQQVRSQNSLFSQIRKKPYQSFVFILCLINISLILVNSGLWITAVHQRLFIAADFTSFYSGAYLVRTGQGEHLYDPEIQSKIQQQLMDGMEFEGGVLLFPNPPYVAIALSPITFLHLGAAYFLWSFIQLGLLFLVIRTLNRQFSYWDKWERIILLITFLAFWPLTYNFLLGQFSLLMLIGILQLYKAMYESKFLRAGLWFLLLSIKPQALLIPAMMILNKRYLRILLTIMITATSLFFASWILLGNQIWYRYFHTVVSIGSYFEQFGVHPKTEYTFRGVLSNIFGESLGTLTNLISIGCLLAGMLLVFILWSRKNKIDSTRFTLLFAFTVTLSIFLSLHLNPHDSLLLVIPAILFYDYLRQNDLPRRMYAILLLISPTVFIFTSFTGFSLFGVIRLPVLIIGLLLAWIGRFLWLDYKGQPPGGGLLEETSSVS